MEMTPGGRRVCLFTGASGQLGRAFCQAYRDEYDIVAVYRRERPWFPAQDAAVIDPLAPGVEQIENRHSIYALRADLLQPGEPRRVVEAALARYGRIDLIVHAAVTTVWAPMLSSYELADSVRRQFTMAVEVPLRLATVTAELFWKAQAASNRAHNRNIVNVSSIAALKVFSGSGQSIYASSKAAMNQLSAHMAVEFDQVGVRVNATAANSFPGWISTERAVEAVHALDHSSVTGQVVVVDGEQDEWLPLDGAARSSLAGGR